MDTLPCGLLASFHPETALFRYDGVNLRVFLCGVKDHAFANPLSSLPQQKIARFQSENLVVASRVSGGQLAISPCQAFQRKPRPKTHQARTLDFSSARRELSKPLFVI